MTTRTRLTGLLAGVALLALPTYASAGGIFQNHPVIGGAQFCSSWIGSPQGQGTITGTAGSTTTATGGICGAYEPAGPATFAGTEVLPADINAPGTMTYAGQPSTALVPIIDLGAGPMVDLTTVATSQTIPNNTPYYFLDGAQGSALTVTMPPNAIEGQIQRIVCEAATVGTLTVAANTSVVTQVVKGNPNAACTAGVGYAWRYQASNLTWYRFQ